jgi:sporulation integral membrane protein YtvI
LEREWIYRILRALLVIFIMIIGWLVAYYVTPLVYPFLIGWLIAYLLNPVVRLSQQRLKLPRWLGTTLSLFLFVGIIASVLTLIITKLVFEIGKLVKIIDENINTWVSELLNFIQSLGLQDMIQRASDFYNENERYQNTIQTNLDSAGTRIANGVSNLLQWFIDSLFALVSSIPNAAAIIIIAILAAFFISKDWKKLSKKLASLISPSIRKSTGLVWSDLQKALFGYLRAQFIIISITAIVVIIGLLLLRVEHAIVIGLLIGAVDLLPYLGTGGVMVPWIIYVFINGETALGIGLSALYGVTLIARQLIEPKVLASSIGLDPLSTLIAMVIGLNLFGFLGLIIGPVSLVILVAIYKARVFQDVFAFIMHGRNKET